jgi:hypothetical protein
MRRSYLAPEIAHLVEAPLSPEEFDRRVSTPMTEEEAADLADLIRWFTRRYPTPKDRLAYARRKFAEWTRPVSIVRRSPSEGEEPPNGDPQSTT